MNCSQCGQEYKKGGSIDMAMEQKADWLNVELVRTKNELIDVKGELALAKNILLESVKFMEHDAIYENTLPLVAKIREFLKGKGETK